MNEATFRQDMYGLLRQYGYWPIRGRDATICPKCHTKLLPPIGRPDILVLSPHGIDRVLETKFVTAKDTGFAFSEISDEQRKWLTRWMEDGGLGYIGIGVQTKPMSAYLVDWDVWLGIEEMLLPYQASIPIDIAALSKPRIALREQGLDLVRLASRFKLHKEKGEWCLPQSHTLLKWRSVNYAER